MQGVESLLKAILRAMYPQRFWVLKATAAILSNATETAELDFLPYINRRKDVKRWQVCSWSQQRDDSVAIGALLLVSMAAEGCDLGVAAVSGASPVYSPNPLSLGGRLPVSWDGKVSVTVRNESNATLSFHYVVGIEPVYDDCP